MCRHTDTFEHSAKRKARAHVLSPPLNFGSVFEPCAPTTVAYRKPQCQISAPSRRVGAGDARTPVSAVRPDATATVAMRAGAASVRIRATALAMGCLSWQGLRDAERPGPAMALECRSCCPETGSIGKRYGSAAMMMETRPPRQAWGDTPRDVAGYMRTAGGATRRLRAAGGVGANMADRRVAWRTGESRGATKGDWQRGQLTASDEGDWRGGRLRDAARGSGVRPANPLPTGMSPLAYVHDLTFRHGLALSAAAAQAWKTFEECLQFRFSPSPERRVLRLEPHAQDSIPSHFQHLHIDVAARGVDGRSRLYKLRDVTGVDERVQAVVAGQKATADCLLAAVGRVEEEDAHEFSFVCHGATHRSVACCMLLAALAYPRALVHMSTARTRCAAAAAGLPTSVC